MPRQGTLQSVAKNETAADVGLLRFKNGSGKRLTVTAVLPLIVQVVT
jgi:hypothetical protein